MALVKCAECGKDVSDKAAFCPSCGCPIKKEISGGTITFWWVGNSGDSLRKTSVFINGNLVATMKCGNKIDIPVVGESQKIELFQGKNLLLTDNVFFNSENQTEQFAYKETIGFSHAKLVKVDAFELNKKPRCPTCGSENIKKISSSKKLFEFGMVGFAGNSVGKTFQCKNCGYKW